mgnify:CR=1 FL=1
MEFIISLLSFILVLGILVTIHEFGHFWVARRCGVKVLRFSVGFGKPLFKFYRKNDPTEYVIAGIPLGGYVKMLDENEAPVDDAEKSQAFNNKPLFSKFLIVSAGPVFNLLFAVFAFWLILVIGEDGLRPVVGHMDNNGLAAHSTLEVADQIVEVNGRPAPIWRVAAGLMTSEMLDKGRLDITVVKPGGQRNTVLLAFEAGEQPEASDVMRRIGISPRMPVLPAVIGDIVRGEAGEMSGLQSGDLIVSVNQQAINSWLDWVKVTRSMPNKVMSVLLVRDGETVHLTVRPKRVMEGGGAIGRIGVSPYFGDDLQADFYTDYQLGWGDAWLEAARQTFSYSILTVKLIGRMLVGEASLQNLSGPISIAQYAGKTASIGLIAFLKFLAFVSVSLGVMNLLPIPMLDGGHLMFYLIEAIKGKPVSEKVQAGFMRIGMVALLCLMVTAVFVDIGRLIG